MELLNLDNYEAYSYDSTKSLSSSASFDGEPPFPCATFDCVLLDAPCSGMGQRPNLVINMSPKALSSYSALQKKLFSNVSSNEKKNKCTLYN